MLGQGIITLFGKPAVRGDGGPLSQRTTLPKLKGERVWLVGANFLVQESFVLGAVYNIRSDKAVPLNL